MSRQHHHHQADHGHAHDVLRVLVARQFRKAVLHDDEQANERPRRHAAQDAEQHEGDRLLHAERSGQRELNVRDRKRRIGADQHPADGGGGTRCDDDGKEGPVGDFRQQNFQRKQHAAERRVEGRRDPRSGARRKQRDLLPGRQPDHLRERRAQRRADLDDRAFAADRRAAADRKRRGQRLDDRDLAADVAALVEDRVHHLGNAVSLGLRRKMLDEVDDDEAADDRREKHPVAEPARRLRDIGIVDEAQPAVIEGVVHEADQRPERDRAEARS